MFDLIQPLIAGPVLPATVLLAVLVAWSIVTILVGFGFDWQGFLPFQLDDSLGHPPVITGLDNALGSVVLTPTRWLNLRSIPLMLWLSVFAVAWWSASLLWWLVLDEWLAANPGPLLTALMIIRNLTCGVLMTKLITAPMQSWFKDSPYLIAKSLVGEEAEICSYDATPEHGQAKFKTGAAPLLLNVRTDGPHLLKGTRVWITYYDSDRRIYLVSPTTTDSTQSLFNGNAS